MFLIVLRHILLHYRSYASRVTCFTAGWRILSAVNHIRADTNGVCQERMNTEKDFGGACVFCTETSNPFGIVTDRETLKLPIESASGWILIFVCFTACAHEHSWARCQYGLSFVNMLSNTPATKVSASFANRWILIQLKGFFFVTKIRN